MRDPSIVASKIPRVFVHLVLLLITLTGCAVPSVARTAWTVAEGGSVVESTRQPSVDKLQSYLGNLAATEPTDVVRVIVQYQGDAAVAIQQINNSGATIVNELDFINAYAVETSAGQLPILASQDAVRWISLDAPVRKSSATDGGAGNLRDDFNDISFGGTSGALPWASPWQEVGEDDGAANGNVAVTSFWGGALQGLRLEGPQIGASRLLPVGDAEQLDLGMAFRRKDFSATDYVALELSRDGGNSWQEALRITATDIDGTGTDPEIQYGDYDLSAYVSDAMVLRLITAPSMTSDATFYLDSIDLRPRYANGAAAAVNRVFLPLVTGSGEAAPDLFAATARNKEDAVVAAHESGCNYYCFDLSKLQSAYIKTIGADRLWNVSPYIRGQGIGVAVVDSGISPHPDFNDYNGNSRIVAHVNFVPNSQVPDDFYGHGTHVAGTIAGLGISSGGRFMGVAPEARLIDVRVTDDYGMGNTSDVVAGLQWIYNNRNTYNIKVANLSLNSTVPESYHASALDAALEVLWFNKIVVVVSAGNEGKEKLYPPANDPFVIVVGSTDDKGSADISDDKLSSFSAYGMTSDGFLKPDLVAPGQDIVSVLASDDMNLKKTLPLNSVLGYENKYFKMSGTSMASAVMAGAVALILEKQPALTPDQVKGRLLSTVRSFSANNSSCATGQGYLDIYAAIHNQSTVSANTGIQASQLLWSGTNPVTWGSVSWNSVSWNSVSWNSVSWNSVSWNSVSWNSVSWNSNSSNNGNGSVDCGAAFTGFTLIDAQTDQDIRPIYENAVIDLDQLNSNSLTVRADTVGPVNSVKFNVNNGLFTKVENVKPFALYGDNNGDYAGISFYPGSYQTEISAYSQSNASGTLLVNQQYQTLLVASWFTPRLKSVRNGLCLQPTSGSNSSGAQSAQGVCGASNSQKFQIKVVPNQLNLVNLVNSQNGLCLDIHSASMANGAQSIQWSCHGGTNQQYRLYGVGDNAYQIIAAHSGKCLALTSDSASASTVVQKTCNKDDAKQQWRLE